MSWMRNEIEKIAKEVLPDSFIIGEVKSVSGNTADVDPLNDDPTLFNVRLNITEKVEGFSLTPKVGSIVLVGCVDGDEKNNFIAMYTEVDAVKINGDQFGGLIKIEELIKKVNNLESDINQLKNLFASWVTVPNDGGAALKTLTTTWAGSLLTTTTKQMLENEKVKHG